MSSSQHSEPGSGPNAESIVGETAALFAEVYQLQDKLEPKNSLAEKWETAAASQAADRMATIYAREFPTLSTADTRAAGRAHVEALFEQDIIENDLRHETAGDVLADERWRDRETGWTVQDSLETVCDRVGMDARFAEALTEFYRLHGQNKDGWKEHAYEAHRIKTTRITGSEQWGKQLAPYFVISVMHHDARTWAEGQAVIQEHYERLFDLNGVTDN